MEFKDVIIYSDIDGTLAYKDGTKSIVPPSNVLAINRFISSGGYFGVATGRGSNVINQMFEGASLNMPYVIANGACVYDNKIDKVYHNNFIGNDIKEVVYNFVKEHKDLLITTMDYQNSLKVCLYDERDYENRISMRQMIDYDTFMKNDYLKVVVYTTTNCEQREEELKKIVDTNKYTLVKSGQHFLEMMCKDVSKAEGIKIAIKEKHLEDKLLVCLGDYENDIPMLKIAHKTICPNDGLDEVKKMVDYITIEHKLGIMEDVLKYIERL